MSKTPDFDRSLTDYMGKEIEKDDDDPMKKLMQKLESMELNQTKLNL